MFTFPYIVLISSELKHTTTMTSVVVGGVDIVWPLALCAGVFAASDAGWVIPLRALPARQIISVQKVFRLTL